MSWRLWFCRADRLSHDITWPPFTPGQFLRRRVLTLSLFGGSTGKPLIKTLGGKAVKGLAGTQYQNRT